MHGLTRVRNYLKRMNSVTVIPFGFMILIIIIDMFLGRIGPITMALLFGGYMSKDLHISYGTGEFYIG